MNRGLCKVANNIVQLNDTKLAPLLAVAEEPPRETELRVLGLHRIVREFQEFAYKDVGSLHHGTVWSWVSKMKD